MSLIFRRTVEIWWWGITWRNGGREATYNRNGTKHGLDGWTGLDSWTGLDWTKKRPQRGATSVKKGWGAVVMIRHGRHVPSQCPKQKHFPPLLVTSFNFQGGQVFIIRHGRHVPSQCSKQKHFPPLLVTFFNISGGTSIHYSSWAPCS